MQNNICDRIFKHDYLSGLSSAAWINDGKGKVEEMRAYILIVANHLEDIIGVNADGVIRLVRLTAPCVRVKAANYRTF